MREEIDAFTKSYKIRKRVIAFLKRYEWIVLIISTILSWILGFIGFYIFFSESGKPFTFSDIAYLSLQLFTFNSGIVDGHIPFILDIARFMAPLTLVYAAIIAFMWFINRQYKKIKLAWYKNHTIFLGMGKFGMQLLKDLQKPGEKIVVVTKEEMAPAEKTNHTKTIYIAENANDKKVLNQLRLEHAKLVMCMSDDDNENISTGFFAGDYSNATKQKSKAKIFVQVSPFLIEQLQELDFDDKASESHAIFWDNIYFFNVYERAARILIQKYSPDTFTHFDQDSTVQAHIIIAGFNTMGQALLLQAGKLCHFANRNNLKATIIHTNSEEVESFTDTFPGIKEVVDLDFIEQKNINERNSEKLIGNTDIHMIFICADDDLVALDAFNKLSILIPKTNLVICHEKTDNFLNRIKRSNVHHFYINDETLIISSIVKDDIDKQAIIIHGSYMLREEDNDDDKVKELKKLTHQKWEKLTEQTKNQNRNQADHIMIKLRIAGCFVSTLIDNEELYNFISDDKMVELLAEVEHRRWNADQLINGWIYGKERKNDLKIHNSIISYEKLTDKVKQYDRDAILNIPLILAAVGLKVVKK